MIVRRLHSNPFNAGIAADKAGMLARRRARAPPVGRVPHPSILIEGWGTACECRMRNAECRMRVEARQVRAQFILNSPFAIPVIRPPPIAAR